MKINTVHWLLIVLMSLPVLASADTGTFDTNSDASLKAFILDNTCSVDAGAAKVFLGNYSVNELSNTGDMTPEVRFSIVMKNCGVAAKKVNVFAEGELDSFDKNGALAIDKNSDEAAEGVAIYIRDENKNILKINNKDEGHVYILEPGKDNSLLFSAQYTGTTGAPKAGRADSNVTLRFDYQ